MTEQELTQIAELTIMVLRDRINSDLPAIDKIRLVKETVSEWGCTDKQASNYNRFAKYDDGSCIYTAPPSGGS